MCNKPRVFPHRYSYHYGSWGQCSKLETTTDDILYPVNQSASKVNGLHKWHLVLRNNRAFQLNSINDCHYVSHLRYCKDASNIISVVSNRAEKNYPSIAAIEMHVCSLISSHVYLVNKSAILSISQWNSSKNILLMLKLRQKYLINQSLRPPFMPW